MTKKTLYLLLGLITILVGTYFYITCCSCCNGEEEAEPLKEEVVTPEEPKATSYPFAFSDGDYAYNEQDNFNFNVSGNKILEPLSAKVEAGIESLKKYLGEHTNNVFDITGYYKTSEKNNSAYPNLGLARANAVKNYLVSKGISSATLNTSGQLMEDMVSKDNIFSGPVKYGITEGADIKDEMAELKAKIQANPLVLYFNTAETSVNLTSEQRQKFADISRYLDKVDGAICNVVGHTDNTGDAANNIKLGQNRADFAKGYLMQNGISGSKINATSKGQIKPIASNATEEGKAKNRRTVVTLK